MLYHPYSCVLVDASCTSAGPPPETLHVASSPCGLLPTRPPLHVASSPPDLLSTWPPPHVASSPHGLLSLWPPPNMASSPRGLLSTWSLPGVVWASSLCGGCVPCSQSERARRKYTQLLPGPLSTDGGISKVCSQSGE